mmetsp:Transcript_90856/g.261792  ORF Transcript_90856/g.261792 Transcript_90856/m.261792 type:complete len:680 (+) Transcript_90856:230-2269(+)
MQAVPAHAGLAGLQAVQGSGTGPSHQPETSRGCASAQQAAHGVQGAVQQNAGGQMQPSMAGSGMAPDTQPVAAAMAVGAPPTMYANRAQLHQLHPQAQLVPAQPHVLLQSQPQLQYGASLPASSGQPSGAQQASMGPTASMGSSSGRKQVPVTVEVVSTGHSATPSLTATRPPYVPPHCPNRVQTVDGVEHLEPTVVRDLLQKKACTLIDLRSQDRAAGLIEGAVHIPAFGKHNFLSRIDELAREWASRPLIIFTCQYSAHRAPQCANWYRQKANPQQRVAILSGGFRGWEAQGLPIKAHSGDACGEGADEVAMQLGTHFVQMVHTPGFVPMQAFTVPRVQVVRTSGNNPSGTQAVPRAIVAQQHYSSAVVSAGQTPTATTQPGVSRSTTPQNSLQSATVAAGTPSQRGVAARGPAMFVTPASAAQPSTPVQAGHQAAQHTQDQQQQPRQLMPLQHVPQQAAQQGVAPQQQPQQQGAAPQPQQSQQQVVPRQILLRQYELQENSKKPVRALPSCPNRVPTIAGIDHLDPTTVYDLMRQGKCLVVDLRGEDRAAGLIDGAVHEPAIDKVPFLTRVPELVERWSAEELVIFTCMYSAHRAPQCANWYREQADPRQQVAILSGGFRQWEALGLPVQQVACSRAVAQAADERALELGSQLLQSVSTQRNGQVNGHRSDEAHDH